MLLKLKFIIFNCLFGFWRRIDYLKCRNERKKEVAQQFKFDQIIVLDNNCNCKSILVLKQDIMENPTGHIYYLPWSTGYWIFDNLAYDKRESQLVFRERTIVVCGDSRECKEFMRLFQNHWKWRGMRVSVFRKTNFSL